jgi:hypothetical protein
MLLWEKKTRAHNRCPCPTKNTFGLFSLLFIYVSPFLFFYFFLFFTKWTSNPVDTLYRWSVKISHTSNAEDRLSSLCKSAPADYHHIIPQTYEVYGVVLLSLLLLPFLCQLDVYPYFCQNKLPVGCGITYVHQEGSKHDGSHHFAANKRWLRFDKV